MHLKINNIYIVAMIDRLKKKGAKGTNTRVMQVGKSFSSSKNTMAETIWFKFVGLFKIQLVHGGMLHYDDEGGLVNNFVIHKKHSGWLLVFLICILCYANGMHSHYTG